MHLLNIYLSTLLIYLSIYSFEVYFKNCICSFISVFICFYIYFIYVIFLFICFHTNMSFDMFLFSFLFICFISMYHY